MDDFFSGNSFIVGTNIVTRTGKDTHDLQTIYNSLKYSGT